MRMTRWMRPMLWLTRYRRPASTIRYRLSDGMNIRV